jgi:hypothetical protein
MRRQTCPCFNMSGVDSATAATELRELVAA